MDLLHQALVYVQQNPSDFTHELGTHLKLSVLAVLIGLVLCFPLGIAASRSRLASLYALNAVGVARAIPSTAILFLAYPVLGIGFRPALLALAVLACPPILVNTNVGFRSIEPAIREAAYGMGMNAWQVLGRVELPLALPVILAGIRTASVDVIASASLATFIGAGGLGLFINEGLTSGRNDILLVGAIPIAALTIGAELTLGAVQPPGRRRRRVTRRILLIPILRKEEKNPPSHGASEPA
jgi:osmoprotectant transport system permease protein